MKMEIIATVVVGLIQISMEIQLVRKMRFPFYTNDKIDNSSKTELIVVVIRNPA